MNLSEQQKDRLDEFVLSIVEQIEKFEYSASEKEYLSGALQDAVFECFEDLEEEDFEDLEDEDDDFDEEEFDEEDEDDLVEDEEDLVEDEDDTGEFESPFSGEQH